MKKYKNREETPKQYRWDLTDFYKDDAQWNQEYQEVFNLFSKVEEYKGTLNNSFSLEKYLLLDIDISNRIDDLYVYAYLSHDVELENPIYIEMKNKAGALYNQYGMINAFALPEILKMDEIQFHQLFISNPNLEKFRRYLEDIYEKRKHTLGEKEEEIISLLTETYSSYSNISSSLIDSEHDYGSIKLQGEEIEIASNNIGLLKRNKNEEIRKKASLQFGKTLFRYQTTESALLNNYVKNNINLSTIRKYDNPWQQKLEEKYLSPEIFDSLIEVATTNTEKNKKYYQLIKSALNLPILHNYDTLLEWSKFQKEYSIEEAQEMILTTLKSLGSDYYQKVKKVFDNHYIDYCQYKGKASGGYSYSTARKDSKILLSFNGQISNIFTIIHEVGHNVHHQYISESNEEWYRYQPNTVAEVASLTNEVLLANYLYKNGHTKEEKLIGIENFIKTFQSNFFGAVMEGQLELKIYDHALKGNSITAQYLNDETEKLLATYQGNTVENDQYANLMWVTRSHYYMNFYLFNYAICISVATVLAQKIIKQEDKILEKYKDFLSCGSNFHPMEVFKKIGIDLTNKKIYKEAVDYFNSQLDLYEKLKKGDE